MSHMFTLYEHYKLLFVDPKSKTNISQYTIFTQETIETSPFYLNNACEILIVDSYMEVLKLPL